MGPLVKINLVSLKQSPTIANWNCRHEWPKAQVSPER